MKWISELITLTRCINNNWQYNGNDMMRDVGDCTTTSVTTARIFVQCRCSNAACAECYHAWGQESAWNHHEVVVVVVGGEQVEHYYESHNYAVKH